MGRIILLMAAAICLLLAVPFGLVGVIAGWAWIDEQFTRPVDPFADRLYLFEFDTGGRWQLTSGQLLLGSGIVTASFLVMAAAAVGGAMRSRE